MVPIIEWAAGVLDTGSLGTIESSMTKVAVSEALMRVADKCVQVMGGTGVSGDTIVEQIFREVRAFRIYDGPTEVHKWSLAKKIKRTTKSARHERRNGNKCWYDRRGERLCLRRTAHFRGVGLGAFHAWPSRCRFRLSCDDVSHTAAYRCRSRRGQYRQFRDTSEEAYVAAYCRRAGRDGMPNFGYYLAFNFFRLAAIFHEIKGRVIRGSAASAQAKERVAVLPELMALA